MALRGIARSRISCASFLPSTFRQSPVDLASSRRWMSMNIDQLPDDDELLGKDVRQLSNRAYVAKKYHRMTRTLASHYRVFPDVLPAFPISVNLRVEFGPGRWDVVYRGNELTQEQVASAPKVSFPMDKLGADHLWTLVLLNADGSKKVHWMLANIPSGDQVEAGDCIVPYTTAYPDTPGAQIFVFALLRQTAGRVDITVPDDFHLGSFAASHRLQPQGLAFYQAKNDLAITPIESSNAEEKTPSRYTAL